jgi:predicted protein tyrosine phosphatase
MIVERIPVCAISHKELKEMEGTEREKLESHDCLIIIHDVAKMDELRYLKDNNILHLEFDDEDKPCKNSMNSSHARAITSWVKEQMTEGTNRIIVSCKGGSCRSAAIAFAIDLEINGYSNLWSDKSKLPNRLVFNLIREEGFTNRFTDEEIEQMFKLNRIGWDTEQKLKDMEDTEREK